MNKEDKEMEYQAGIDKLYNQTQAFGRIDFVKVLFDTKKELDIANKKLDKIEKYIKENACYSETKKECLCSFSSLALDKILEIIGGEEVSNE